MNFIKLFEEFHNEDQQTLLDLFQDMIDTYTLDEIDYDPCKDGSMSLHLSNFPGNCFRIRNSPKLLIEDEGDYGVFSITIYLTTTAKDPWDAFGNKKMKSSPQITVESLLINDYPNILNDIDEYKKSIDSFTKHIGYKSSLSKVESFRPCSDFNLIEIILNFRIKKYDEEAEKKKEKENVERMLRQAYKHLDNSQDADMIKKLKDLGYNIVDEIFENI
jgi:hypothetical protein